MSNVIWSGNSATSGSRSGPGTGVSYGGASSTPNITSSNNSSPIGPSNNPKGNVEEFDLPVQANSAFGSDSRSMSSVGSVIDYIGKVMQGFSGLQTTNNRNLKDIAEAYNDQAITSAKKANEFTEKMINKQMQFQQYNADTAYQRAVKDLKAAGLNPILAAFNGGASSPSGSSAHGVAANIQASGYDQGYGLSGLTSSMMTNLFPLTLASILNGSPKLKGLVDKIANFVDNSAGKVLNIVDGNHYKTYNGKTYDLNDKSEKNEYLRAVHS